MPFQKGNKFGKGGARPGGGGKPKGYSMAKLMAKDMAKAYIEASVKPVMHQYFQLAAGRMVNKYFEGKIIGQEFEADPPTTRHFVDKIVPDEVKKDEDKRPMMLNIVLQNADETDVATKPDPKLIELTFQDEDEKPK